MNLKQELKESGRYEYDKEDCDNGKSGSGFCSHKYKDVILFLKDVDMIQYITYDDGNPEGNVLFEISTEFPLYVIENLIDNLYIFFKKRNRGAKK